MYVEQFVTHHAANPQFATLTRDHVSVAISVFMCGLPMFNTQHVHEHCLQAHGLPGGIASLRPMQTIALDKDTNFICPDLQNIEDVGPEEKRLAVESVYNMSVAKGVFETFNNSRSSADLCRARSQEFLRELKKKCPTNFYRRFFMKLGRKLYRKVANRGKLPVRSRE